MRDPMPRDTWFLLRGLSREAGHWGEFVPAFAAAMPDVDVVTLDLPGAGARRGEPWPGTVADAMERVRAEALRHPAARRFVLAVSLGGMLTMEWAARHPEELAGVVIGASSARDLSPFWKRLRPGAWRPIVLGSLERDIERREAKIVRTIVNRPDLWDATATAWAALARERPLPPATARGQLLAATRWQAPALLRVPALFLAGASDKMVHADCSRALARRYGAPLVLHPTAGHDLTTDAGDWVTAEVRRWHASRS